MPNPFQRIVSHSFNGCSWVVAAHGTRLAVVYHESVASWETDENGVPSPKRQKLEPASSVDLVSGSEQDDHPSFVNITAWESFIVGATGQDKCIRVFELSNNELVQISARYMPKRPCAIIVEAGIIYCADKFGDVYALPLLGRPWVDNSSPTEEVFKPSATLSTVHTQRNRKALQQQEGQKVKQRPKKALTFDHDLIIGHVSLLTDIAAAGDCILSADRDEHIRVSRRLQPHIIVNYCLGHTQFVSCLCIPSSRPDRLISGGGDTFLLLWDWRSGELLQQLDLSPYITDSEFVVSKILASHDTVVVALEQQPFFLVFRFADQLSFVTKFNTLSNVVDATITEDGQLIYALDCRESGPPIAMAMLDRTTGTLDSLPISIGLEALAKLADGPHGGCPDHSLDELLYPLSGLRKHVHGPELE